VARFAGKDVQQQQASVTVRHFGAGDNRMELTLFGVRRTLENPLATNVFVDLSRLAGGARLSWTTRAGGGDRAPRLTVGVDLQRMRDDRKNFVASLGKATDTTLLNQLETVTELGPFLHAAWSPIPVLLLAGGTRYDRVTFDVQDRHLTDGVDNSGARTMAAWSGSLGASLVALADVTPYVNVSTSFETPTTTELANQPGTAGGFNDRLNPQRAVNYEIGVRSRPTHGVEFSAAAFLGRIRDALIQFQEIGGRAFFSNAGRLHNDGIELGLELTPISAVHLSTAYTYAHYRFAEYRIVTGTTVDTLDGNQLAGVPEHFVRFAVRLEPTPNLRVDVEQQMSSGLFADDANTIRVKGWGGGVTAVRISAWKRLGRLRVEGFGGINNLFGRAYVSSVTVNGFGGRVFEPGPGRNGYAGINLGYR
jgi:iron complex outermembrane receptor protein